MRLLRQGSDGASGDYFGTGECGILLNPSMPIGAYLAGGGGNGESSWLDRNASSNSSLIVDDYDECDALAGFEQYLDSSSVSLLRMRW